MFTDDQDDNSSIVYPLLFLAI